MSVNQENKKLIVEEIKQKVEKAKSIVFIDYRGITVNNDTAMRREFAKNGCEYKIYKNRLVLRALNDLGITGFDDKLQGTLAVAFSFDDEVSAPKIAKKAVKDNQSMSIAFGIVNNQFADTKALSALAELPSREVLIAKLLGMLNAPATGLVSVLNGPARAMVYALNGIVQKG
jgi:large subunit ribosomal protein L10